ncbi:hypothetical protein ACP3V3_02000 [Vibrio sp. PNB22_3_1]
MSHLRAYYIHNVFHTHRNEFGKGRSSDLVMVLVRCVDEAIDIDAVLDRVHDELKGDGVAFINETETKKALIYLEEALNEC